MEIVTFATTKGGVGKTTLTFNFASYLAHQGKKVLLMDLDQQNSLSRTYDQTDQIGTVEQIFNVYETDRQPVVPVNVRKNIDLIVGATNLDKIQSRLVPEANKNVILLFWLKQHVKDIVEKYDYLIIDCHNDLGIATANAIAVSDVVFCPVTPAKYSVESMADFETRFEVCKNETINYDTGKTIVKAKLYYIANRISHINNSIDKNFIKAVDNDTEHKWIAKIPERILLRRTNEDGVSISDMQDIAQLSVDKLTSDQKSNLKWMENRKYYKSQNPEKYNEFNILFDKIAKFA